MSLQPGLFDKTPFTSTTVPAVPLDAKHLHDTGKWKKAKPTLTKENPQIQELNQKTNQDKIFADNLLNFLFHWRTARYTSELIQGQELYWDNQALTSQPEILPISGIETAFERDQIAGYLDKLNKTGTSSVSFINMLKTAANSEVFQNELSFGKLFLPGLDIPLPEMDKAISTPSFFPDILSVRIREDGMPINAEFYSEPRRKYSSLRTLNGLLNNQNVESVIISEVKLNPADFDRAVKSAFRELSVYRFIVENQIRINLATGLDEKAIRSMLKKIRYRIIIARADDFITIEYDSNGDLVQSNLPPDKERPVITKNKVNRLSKVNLKHILWKKERSDAIISLLDGFQNSFEDSFQEYENGQELNLIEKAEPNRTIDINKLMYLFHTGHVTSHIENNEVVYLVDCNGFKLRLIIGKNEKHTEHYKLSLEYQGQEIESDITPGPITTNHVSLVVEELDITGLDFTSFISLRSLLWRSREYGLYSIKRERKTDQPLPPAFVRLDMDWEQDDEP